MWKNKLIFLADLIDHLCVPMGRSQLLSHCLTCNSLYRIYVSHPYSILGLPGFTTVILKAGSLPFLASFSSALLPPLLLNMVFYVGVDI